MASSEISEATHAPKFSIQGMKGAVPDWIDTIFVGDASFGKRSARPIEDLKQFLEGMKSAWRFRCCGGSHRPELPDYDAEISIFNTIFSWHGTIMPLVLNRPLFWLQLGLHGSLCAWHLAAQEDEEYVDIEPLEWSTLSIPSSLVVFFIVFYSSQCYARYFELYGHCVGIGGAIMCWVALCKLNLKRDDTLNWNCTRFMLAAQHVVYYGLSQGGLSTEEWGVIRKRYLLTENEVLLVRGYGGFKPLLLITWATQRVV